MAKRLKLPRLLKAESADLTEGSIFRHLIVFSIPMFFSTILQISYALVNAFWVGKGLGSQALAEVTVCFSIYFVLIAIAAGLTLSTSILVSQAYGSHDPKKLQQAIDTGIVLTGAISLVCMVVGLVFSNQLLTLLNTPAELIPVAQKYLYILLLATPFLFGMFLAAAILRGTGDSITPLWFQGGAVVLTAVLDPLLMFGLLGLPRLGVFGTGYAAVIAHVLMLIALLYYLKRTGHTGYPNWRNLQLDRKMARLTLKIGVPYMLQQALVAGAMVAIVGLVNNYGSAGTAAYGVAIRLDQLAMTPGSTIGMAVSLIAGQNIGAQRYDRVKKVFWSGLLLSFGVTLFASGIIMTIPAAIMDVFVNDPNVISIGAMYLRFLAVGYLLFSITYVSNGIINGSGHTMVTTVLTLISLWVIRIPLAAILSNVTGEIASIWIAIVVSFAALMLTSLAYYAHGGWKKELLPSEPEPELV